MCPVSDRIARDPIVNLAEARDCMHLMLLEFGDVHIETLGQLLKLTNTAEREYSHICCQRLTSGINWRAVNSLFRLSVARV